MISNDLTIQKKREVKVLTEQMYTSIPTKNKAFHVSLASLTIVVDARGSLSSGLSDRPRTAETATSWVSHLARLYVQRLRESGIEKSSKDCRDSNFLGFSSCEVVARINTLPPAVQVETALFSLTKFLAFAKIWALSFVRFSFI